MINFLSVLFLIIPLSVLSVLSLLNAYQVFYHKRTVEGEISFLHLSIIFMLGTVLFIVLLIAVITADLSLELFLFSLGNTLVWIIFTEISLAYLSTFLNKSSVIEKYFPVVLGISVGISLEITVTQTYSINFFHFGVYFFAILILLIIAALSIYRVHISIQTIERPEDKDFLCKLRNHFFIGALILGYILSTSLIWVFVKGISNFSLDISHWGLYDWLVYLSLPLLLLGLFKIYLFNRSLDFGKKIDLPTILNTLDT